MKIVNLFLISLGALVLSGCFGDMFKAKPDDTTFFILTSTCEVSDRDTVMDLNLMPLVLPSYMSRSQIVTLNDEVRVALSENARWIENVESGVARVVVNSLENSLGKNSTVYLYPLSAHANANSLRITITDLIGSLNGQTKIKAKWIYISADEKTELLSEAFEKTIDTGSSYEEYVKTMSSLLTALSKDISVKILTYKNEQK